MITTVQIPKNKSRRHYITIPAVMWRILSLTEKDYIQLKINRFGSDICMISTIQIPFDTLHRHQITIPKYLWHGLNLKGGMFVQIDINKVVVTFSENTDRC